MFDDDPRNPDCVDGTDEPVQNRYVNIYPKNCYLDSTFRCEEQRWRTLEGSPLECSDGSITTYLSVSYTSGCQNDRDHQIKDAIRSYQYNKLLSEKCWNAIYNFTDEYRDYSDKTRVTLLINMIEQNCKDLFMFPTSPISYGHVFLMYTSDRFYNEKNMGQPKYICFNSIYCPFIKPTMEINGSSCISYLDLNVSKTFSRSVGLSQIVNVFQWCYLPNERQQCNNSETMYQCQQSLNCISTRRLFDGKEDCYGGDDEKTNFTCSLKNKVRISCPLEDKCVSHLKVSNAAGACLDGSLNDYFIRGPRTFSFPILCDGFVEFRLYEIAWILFTNSSETLPETDEDHCEEWPCNNLYTRCDGFWNCPNGADELNCSLLNSCAPDGFECISPETFNISCLPPSKADDNHMDCIGGTDERFFCRDEIYARYSTSYMYRCWNSTLCLSLRELCDQQFDCLYGDDEKMCDRRKQFQNISFSFIPTSIFNLLRGLSEETKQEQKIYFSLVERVYDENPFEFIYERDMSDLIDNSQEIINQEHHWFCNRGLLIFYRQQKLTNENARCLCPTSYYGDRCQFEAQRVSISFRFRTLDFRTVFIFIIMLVDNTFIIHSYAQQELLPMRDCDLRVDVALLYSHRPKNDSLAYTIRIDAFDKLTWRFRATWLFPVEFPVLPVYRLSTILLLFSETNMMTDCSKFGCVHGDCVLLENTREAFCRCFDGWSGLSCNKFMSDCNCASDSICVGLSNNRSICICPLGKFGPRCFLTRSSCQPNPCQNSGLCVPTDVRIGEYNFTCICKEGYTGERCQYSQSQIAISFSQLKYIPLFVYVHFITVMRDSDPLRSTILKRIAYDQDSTIISISDAFNLAFIEFDRLYYLIVLQTTYIPSQYHNVVIEETNRCPPINELFNSTILSYEILRCVKYYHKLCREQLSLLCFYDEQFMCLCTNERHANCFFFNHTMKYICQGLDYCQNSAQCFENNPKCPSSMICVCSECFYGSKCQFKTQGMSLSLDAILGYQIRLNNNINQQSRAVKVSLTIVTILFVLGMINSILSLLTFYRKKCREVSCGIYLFCSSIISLLISILLILKFIFLLLIQTQTITNRSFLTINCMTMDMILSILLSIIDWLNAFVGVERCIMTIKSTKFDKKTSRKVAKKNAYTYYYHYNNNI